MSLRASQRRPFLFSFTQSWTLRLAREGSLRLSYATCTACCHQAKDCFVSIFLLGAQSLCRITRFTGHDANPARDASIKATHSMAVETT